MDAHSMRTNHSSRDLRTGSLTKRDRIPAEPMHERSARLQREQGLRMEVEPGQGLIPLRTDFPLVKSDPYSVPDMDSLREKYGEHQLGAFAYQFSAATLREIAGNLGIGHPGRSRREMVSAIVSQVTRGRYSANFSAASAGSNRATKASGERSAPRRSTRAKPEALPPLTPVRHDLPLQKSDPYSPPNPTYLVLAYGRPQLVRALQDYSVDSLKQTSAQFELKFPGTKPTNRGQRASLIAYIVAQYDREQAN